MVEEVLGGDDRHVGVRVDDAEHPAEVVDVRVGVDDGGDLALATMAAIESKRG